MLAEKSKKAAPKTAGKKTQAKKIEAPKAALPAKSVEVTVSHGRKREMVGVVVSDKMSKTIVVKVDRNVRHQFYKKYLTKTEKYKAHDEGNVAKVGDLVQLIESRPLSSQKRWALKTVIRKALQES